jgi:two-component system, OmpR family, response regulator
MQSTSDVSHDHQEAVSALVVDISQPNRDFIQAHLLRLGFSSVYIASSGEEAVVVCGEKKDEIILVISDVQMPDTTGHELIGKLRSAGSEAGIILCSGGDTDLHPCPIHSECLCVFLLRPFNTLVFSLAVVSALRAKRFRGEAHRPQQTLVDGS